MLQIKHGLGIQHILHIQPMLHIQHMLHTQHMLLQHISILEGLYACSLDRGKLFLYAAHRIELKKAIPVCCSKMLRSVTLSSASLKHAATLTP